MSTNTAEYGSQQVRAANMTESERHSLLRSKRRRTVLDVLEEKTTQVQLADVACEVANREDGPDAADVKISLHHNHLPKMDDLGVLEYDPSSNLIRV